MVLLIVQSFGRSVTPNPNAKSFGSLISSGMIEGYQTFDAIAAVVVGAVLVLSVKNQFNSISETKRPVVTFRNCAVTVSLSRKNLRTIRMQCKAISNWPVDSFPLEQTIRISIFAQKDFFFWLAITRFHTDDKEFRGC